jgi:beta-1,4-N-acetylglucosaminyltransferase
MSTVFVTTGATVVFEDLIKFALDPQMVKTLQRLGYSKIIVQYGREGLRLFEECLDKLKDTGMEVEGFSFSHDIGSVISPADLVISHAGTGSILDTLRLKKKLIVMINDKLMDNHQVDIADELQDSHYLLKTAASMDELLRRVKEIQSYDPRILPSPREGAIERILQEL